MNRDEGGSAYPHKAWSDSYSEHAGSSGMSLRDYFAGQALMGLCTQNNLWNTSFASDAYYLADAMLKARKEP